MIQSFIINCRTCPMGTPCDINLRHTQDQVQVTFICRGCRKIESQNVGAEMMPYFPPPEFFIAPPGYWLQPKKVQEEEEQPKEEAPAPEIKEVSDVSKLMQRLITSENLKQVEKHKHDFKEWEYNYIIDMIKKNKEERKTKKLV